MDTEALRLTNSESWSGASEGATVKLWPCFVCGSDELCKDREPEIVAIVVEWLRRLEAAEYALPARKPAARETGAILSILTQRRGAS